LFVFILPKTKFMLIKNSALRMLLSGHCSKLVPKIFLLLIACIFFTAISLHATTHENITHQTILSDTTVVVSICEGEIFEFNGQSLVSAGTYSATYTAQDGSDSTVILELSVNPVYNLSISVSICEGESYELGGIEYFDPGLYSVSMISSLGCDSTVELTLDVLYHSLTLLSESVCENVGYPFNGELLTETGVYTALLPAANGCDSLIVLELSALSSPIVNQNVTICPGSSYLFEGEVFSQAGVYSFSYTGQNGCDSVMQLSLQIATLDTTYLLSQICEGGSLEYNGDILTEEGTYEYLFASSFGCDSVVYLTIEWLPLGLDLITVRQCPGTSYIFNGEEIVESGVYTLLSVGSNGCDSLTVLDIAFTAPLETTLQATICSNEPYDFQGSVLNESGLYSDTLQSVLGGCDSIVYLQLTVIPAPRIEVVEQICSGGSYSFAGSTFTESGNYELTVPAADGCDTIFSLSLNVTPPISTALGVTICEGDFFNYSGQQLTSAGLYPFTFVSQEGCDSIVTINLSVLPAARASLTVDECGSQFIFFNESLTESGNYTFVLENASSNGCDSIIELSLTLFPSSEPTLLEASICVGEVYQFGDFELTQAGTYTDSLQNTNGCDSLVVLNLTVVALSVELVEFEGNLIASSIEGASYQWVDCSSQQIIPGANLSTFTPTSTGNYGVIVTLNGCSLTSECKTAVVVNDLEVGNNEFVVTVFPNPASDYINVAFNVDPATETEVILMDLVGKPVLRQRMLPSQRVITIFTHGLPSGQYILQTTNSSITRTQPILIK
jgi:hypothetical protein